MYYNNIHPPQRKTIAFKLAKLANLRTKSQPAIREKLGRPTPYAPAKAKSNGAFQQ